MRPISVCLSIISLLLIPGLLGCQERVRTGPHFSVPLNIAIGPDHKIYITDEENNRIVRINDMTGAGWISYSGPPNDPLGEPTGIAIGPDGKIYVSDYDHNRVVCFNDMTGSGWNYLKGITQDVSQQDGYQGFDTVLGIAIGADGNIYVADGGSDNRIVCFKDISGAGWKSFWYTGIEGQQFFGPYGPYGIALGLDGKIYVGDCAANRIVRINDMIGTGWTTLGSQGNGKMQFGWPGYLALGPDGKIYVADTTNNRVVRVNDMTGAGWTTWTVPSNYANAYPHLQGITVAPDGKIYMTDTANNCIIRINDMSGAGLMTF